MSLGGVSLRCTCLGRRAITGTQQRRLLSLAEALIDPLFHESPSAHSLLETTGRGTEIANI